MSNEPRRLYRSRDERMIGGVCGGLGEYLNTDPTIIRVLFVIIALSGAGIFLYLAMWLIVPEEPMDVTSAPTPVERAVPEEPMMQEPPAEAPAPEEPTE